MHQCRIVASVETAGLVRLAADPALVGT